MEFLEKDLEEIIYLSDKDKLSNRGLYLEGTLKRQLKIGNYGIADLVEIRKPYFHNKRHHKGIINILELKKDKIGVSTFFQALNYLQGIRIYLQNRGLDDLFNYQITLIGKEVDVYSSFVYLPDIFCDEIMDRDIREHERVAIELYTYKYGVEGIELKHISGYELQNKGF